MDTGELINVYRRQANMTVDELVTKSGIPKGTLTKILGGTTKAPTLDNMKAIARALGRTLADFDDPAEPTVEMSPTEYSLITKYRGLDAHGKRIVDVVIDEEISRIAAEFRRQQEALQQETAAELAPRMKVILFGNSFAAGPAEPDFGNRWESMEVDPDSPAEFAVRIHGDSMEPYLKDNQIAYGRRRMPQDGEVGAFLLDGAFLCKQVCIDALGNIYLFSLNRARADDDVTVWHDSGRSLTYFGTILLDQKPPLP